MGFQLLLVGIACGIASRLPTGRPEADPLIPVPGIEPSHEVRVRCRCNTVGVEREREHGASRGSLSQVRVAGGRRACVRDPDPHPAWPARNVGGCRAQPRPCALQGQARARGDRVPGWRSAAASISRPTCIRGGSQSAECRGKRGQKLSKKKARRLSPRNTSSGSYSL